MSKNIIEIIDLSYKDIFNGLSIAIEENKFISLTGPNNCGKTTLLRILDRQIDVFNSIVVNDIKLEKYKITDLSPLIKTVIPKEIIFINNTVEEEINFYLEQTTLTKEEKNKRYQKIIKEFKLNKLLEKELKSLEDGEIVKLQLVLSLIVKPQILLLDNIGIYYNKKDMLDILNILKEYQEQEKITIIMVTNNLEETLFTDYIYVISDSNILIEGKPLDVIQKDNVMNKAGLNLPFMVDLSVKLRDYDLVKEIEQDKERMVELLWK